MGKQKFPRGTKVKIADDLGPGMSHFCGKGGYAFVAYTYGQKYHGGSDPHKDYCLYLLDKRGKVVDQVSWYKEWQLSEASASPGEFQEAVANYIH